MMRTDTEIVTELRMVLGEQLQKFRYYSALQEAGEVDESYVDDCAGDWFNEAPRWVFADVLRALESGDE